MKSHLLALALTASGLLQTHAIEPGKSQTLSSPDQVPEGLARSDWQSIRQAYQAAKSRSAANAGLITQQAYLKASNTGASDNFGSSVAVSGDTVVVGAYREDSNTTGVNGNQANDGAIDSGAAYVFVRSGGTWSQQAYLKASSTGAGDYFGMSVAVSGDTIVVGSPRKDLVGSILGNPFVLPDLGAAYVFVRSGGVWTEQVLLTASNKDANDQFGGSVAISGDTIVVGATGESSNAVGVNNNQENNLQPASGAAYVFTRSSGSWSQQAYLKASNTEASDLFGGSVAVSGDTVVVGANFEDSNAIGVNGNAAAQADNSASLSGAAYVFTRSGAAWSQQAYLKASNTGASDQFGNSVAISGETVVVGAIFEFSKATGVGGNQGDNSAVGAGAAYVFTRSGAAWSQQAYLKASNTEGVDQFGGSVAVSGDTVVVGAFSEDSNAAGINGSQGDNSANASGAAYVFGRSGVAWSQQAYLKASNPGAGDGFGLFVAISGTTVIVGASLEDSITTGVNSVPNDAGAADDSGAAYIFTFPVAVPPIVEPPIVNPPVVVKFLVTVKTQSTLGKVTGAGSFTQGSTVILKAKPKKGRTFLGWYEKKKPISKKKVLVIKSLTANRSLVAKFK